MIKIIDEGFPSEEEILLGKCTIEYVQEEDCSGEDSEPQTLTISTRNNGIGNFLNIRTDSWSINSSDELEFIIKDFEKRIRA